MKNPHKVVPQVGQFDLDLFQFLIIFTNYVVDSNNDSVLGILLPGECQRMEYCVKLYSIIHCGGLIIYLFS